MKTQLEIGDKIKRFEVRMSIEIEYTYIIDSLTKTLAKSEDTIFKRDLNYDTIKPKKSTKKIVARVYLKEKTTSLTSPDYFLIEND
jgi:hypothetical protein